MEAALTDRLWDIEDIVKLVADPEPVPKKRGPYKEMILRAFEYPWMLTSETRSIAIEEFRDSEALRCYRDSPTIGQDP